MAWNGSRNDPRIELVNAALMKRLMALVDTPLKEGRLQWAGGDDIAGDDRALLERLSTEVRIESPAPQVH